MFKRMLRRALLGAICAALLYGAVFASDDPSLTFHQNDGHYRLEGTFDVDASQQVIWEVLTDYSHIPEFVSSMKISRIQKRSGNDLVLYQEPEGGFFIFTKRVHLTLAVHETPEKSITFKDTSLKDFDVYQGSWRIRALDRGGTFEITYDLDAKQNFDAPGFMASDAATGGAKDLLSKVRDEILRRKKQAQPKVQITQTAQAKPDPLEE